MIITVRKISENGLELIKKFEGFSSKPYICAAGFWTIGWGHEILPGEKFGNPLTEAEASAILQRDVMIAERSVCRLINVPLTDEQYDALVSWTFNLGGGRLQCSTLRQKVNRAEHHLVPEQIVRWVFAGGRKLSGLIKRRNLEAMLYAA